MPVASMAEQVSDEPGAPVPKDAIDPELIKLKRARPKIGVITAAGLVFLCGYFLIRLGPDRRFAGGPAVPDRTALVDVLGGNIGLDRFIKLEGAEPLMSHAVRTTTSKGSLGLRAVPIRGTGDRVWIAMSGDGWDPPALGAYSGRLRRLSDLPFAKSIIDYATEHPRPVFATAVAVRAGFGAGKVQSVSNDTITVADSDRIAFDVIDTSTAVIVCILNDRFPTAAAWSTALAAAGLTITGQPHASDDAVRYTVTVDAGLAALGTKLENARLWAARVEPVTHHYDTTWSALKGSPPGGFVIGGTTIPDAQLDLVGLYVERSIPGDAYVVITNERPEDYWYVLPITVALGIIGLVFAWALVRAVKRDLLPTRA
jgi:hypothetical protein